MIGPVNNQTSTAGEPPNSALRDESPAPPKMSYAATAAIGLPPRSTTGNSKVGTPVRALQAPGMLVREDMKAPVTAPVEQGNAFAHPKVFKATVAWVSPSAIRNSQATVSFLKHRPDPYTMRDIMDGLKTNPLPPSLIPDVVQMEDGTLIAVDNSRVAAAKILKLERQCVQLLPANLPLERNQKARFRVVGDDGQVKTASTWGEAVRLRIESSRYSEFPKQFPHGVEAVPKISQAPQSPTWHNFRQLPWARA